MPQVDMSQFDKNPFEAFMAQGGPMPQGTPQMQAPQSPTAGGRPPMPAQGGQGMPGGMGQEVPEPTPEDQLQYGKNPDSSKTLLGAVQALEKYISESTDRDTIQTARGIIMLLSQLIQKDQEKFSKF